MRPQDHILWREYLRLDGAAREERARTGRDPDAIIVGEDNPMNSREDLDLADLPPNASGGRLRSVVLGCSREVYLSPRVLRRNLCRGKWNAQEARTEAARLAAEYPEAAFILLGVKVRIACGLPRHLPAEAIAWVWAGESYPETFKRIVVALPHPSGRNQIWRSAEAVPECRAALRRAGLGWLVGTD